MKPGKQPALAGVELLRKCVTPTPFPLIREVECPGPDSTGSCRAAVEEAALIGTSQALEKSCKHVTTSNFRAAAVALPQD